MIYAIALLIGASAWEYCASLANPAFFPRFTKTMARIGEYALSGTLTSAFLNSMGVYLTGLGIAIVVGTFLGLLLARVRLLRCGRS